MKLKHTLSIALGGYTVNLIINLATTFLFNEEAFQNVYTWINNSGEVVFCFVCL